MSLQINMSDIGIVILAAGASRRLGQPKQLVEFQGKTLLEHTVNCAIASQANVTVVVLGEVMYQNPSCHVLVNPNWQEGMAASIRVGLNDLVTHRSDLSAVIISVCDQPFISTDLFNQLITQYHTQSSLIVAASYGDILGVPALFDRQLFPELFQLQGDTGARKIIQKYQKNCQSLLFPQGAVDIDTPADLQFLVLGAARPCQSILEPHH
jgi:molybdenum cofactor cytidylyltransferase